MVANGDALPEYECQPLLGMHIYFLSLCPLYLASPYFLSLSLHEIDHPFFSLVPSAPEA